MLDNMLDLNELRVLDLCAGTGNISFEFVSRGAAHLLAIDSHPRCVQYLKQNVQTLQIAEQMQVYKSDCVIYCRNAKNIQYDLIFADPPYGRGLGEKAVAALMAENWIAKDAVLVLEEKTGALPHDLDGFELDDERVLGETTIGIYRRTRLR